jgi:hypothetical protein
MVMWRPSLRGVGVGRRDAGHDVAGALAHEAEHVELGHQRLHHREHRLVERHIHHLARTAVHFLVAQRHQRAERAPQRGDRVADRDPGLHRRAVGKAGHVAQPAHRLADGAEAGLLRHRPALAEARQAHHDQAGVDLRQRLPAQAELVEHAGAEVLHHDVGLGHQPAHHLDAVRVLQVHRHRLLVARLQVPPQRGALVELAPLAQRIAAIGRFDLDHLGAELGEDARGEGAGDQGAEFDDLEAGEGFGGRGHGGVGR